MAYRFPVHRYAVRNTAMIVGQTLVITPQRFGFGEIRDQAAALILVLPDSRLGIGAG